MIRRWLTSRLYDAFLVCAFFVSAPRIFYKVFFHGKYIDSWKIRFGVQKPFVKGEGPLVWFHGASVGEVSLLAPLLNRWREEFPEWRFVVTTCSEAGVHTARRLYESLGATVFVLPLDLSCIIKSVVRKLAPDIVIFSEGDCWLHFLTESKRLGAKAFLINGKLSEHSCKRFSFLKRLGRNYFAPLDLLILQDELYKQRFMQIGISSDKIHVTGNMKTFIESSLATNRRDFWRAKLQISSQDRLIVLGSMHPKDVEVWAEVVSHFHNSSTKILWVPRHLEKLKEHAKLLEKAGILFGLWSQGASFRQYNSLIMDAMGVLKDIYSAADIAFVGGTFDPSVGGHNLLEPLQKEVPLMFGPYIYSQSVLAEKLREKEAGLSVNKETLLDVVTDLLQNEKNRQAYIEKGKSFLKQEENSFQQTWEILKSQITCMKI
ncbi:lipid IV(A) 3-deoxy-D-manno-octulosonic acid transferase [Chlamydia trachomatis]|uniref:3-deoxy-D-manno-octulosonic acid transferase n=1 Tax=Chlamydia trachomatis serovar D (strain ATCC VR-885 / DSM 19411 / UW-3/Cx) TaxID=272561 RepID=KDTA_CHLTR|nr:lipid IV(A) 3-deoxy-D-manno-octulosonic acid transferase [Chlamydia trachomatis]NP_219712.1 3-deoxy-D-manno-octulosonic acid transferase [Chlamydia trachomatis D/UW-3/CX]P0CE14.1 RecName: Full=3-deoxy-D-manno-octulosonic acid transferase; Short=Kdo transferase; AltName: Full=Kdo(2)-lipid IV(A) 3-deoxy-D-manno-octulosonic acid transferase; AltName: Full=Kdo-lipid IV(A) 3-deoxy-D-manno-octulosonic acid transferase; AltName: Full=Lipid IV(A) 3-deoxy-D-manno-octulosonic acid transferase; AltName: 